MKRYLLITITSLLMFTINISAINVEGRSTQNENWIKKVSNIHIGFNGALAGSWWDEDEDDSDVEEEEGEIMVITGERIEYDQDWWDDWIMEHEEEEEYLDDLDAIDTEGDEAEKALCIEKATALENKCLTLYGGIAVVTAGFCARLGSDFTAWGRSCNAAAAGAAIKAAKWCTDQGKEARAKCD